MEQTPIIDGETGMAGLGALFGDPEVVELRRCNEALRNDLNRSMQELERLNQENSQFRSDMVALRVALSEERDAHRNTRSRMRDVEDRAERYERIIDKFIDE